MTTSPNFKKFHSTVDKLVVNRTSVSSRFKIQSARAKTRMLKSIAEAEILPTLENEILETETSQVESLFQMTACNEALPIAYPVPNLSYFDEKKNQISRKESWFSKLFSLKPKAL